MECPSCASAVPESARFCPSCGHGVVARGDERRVATVLFADLAGFTGMSETLDPEHVKNLVDRCFARLASDVTAHGGRVDKVVGDAIVALFGAPVAHEDDAERAVRTGLTMQRSIAVLSSELGLPLQLRVGINSGEVLVGAMRAGGDYTAMGDVVNVASRLQTLAAPGTVVVGAATHAATASVVRYELLGPLVARGREAPVDAWLAVESLSTPGRRPRRPDVPLTGRGDELTVLRQSVAMAIRRSRPSVTFLLGEAGMGKSRLIEEVAGWAAAAHGALVLEGRCVPYGEANPWWPLAEAVRRACGVEIGDTAADTVSKVHESVARICDLEAGSPEAAQIASGLLHLMGDQDALPDVDPQRARQEARRSLHALISGLTAAQPVVLVLSELHWADEVVLDLFGYHLDRLAGRPLAILVSSRFELMDRWDPPHGRYNLLTLHLDPLDREATRRLASSLGADSLPPDVVDALVARSGGNPFFLEELLTFVGEGEPGSPGGELPVTLRGLVAARIDALTTDERAVLEDAAVIGRTGSLVILRALSGKRGVADVDGVIDRLFERDLLVVAPGRWEFRSDVVREVVYGTLTKSERARLHWRVGSWLAEAGRRTGRTDEMLELVAHHYATAAEMVIDVGPVPTVPDDVLAVAVDAVERAAAWASRRELPAAAIRLFERGVPLASEGSPERARMLLERALEWTALREPVRAREDLEAAGSGCAGTLGARQLTVLGVVQQLEGDLAGSAETLRRAAAAWQEAGDRSGQSDALRRFGLTCMLSGRPADAEDAFEEALAIARDLGSRRDEAWALWHLAELSFYAGRQEEAEGRLHDAGQAFQEAGDTGGLGWVKGLLGYLRFVEGNRDEAEQLALSILEDLRDRNDRWALGMVTLLLASVHLWQGRSGRAAVEAAEARQAFADIHDLEGELRASGTAARALAASGKAREARAVIEEVLSRKEKAAPDDPNLAVAFLYADLGDGERALEVARPTDFRAFVVDTEVTRGLASLQCGRIAEGRAILESAAGDAAGPYGCACLALARAASGEPRSALEAADRCIEAAPLATYRDLALAHLARACALHQQPGEAPPEVWLTAIAAARQACAATEDVLITAVVELAAARLAEASGEEASGLAVRRAVSRLDEIGAYVSGWDTAISAAIRGLAAAAG
jgi:class 3 adenylate cyclase/tetratricopeptide (TPR) repeat protein